MPVPAPVPVWVLAGPPGAARAAALAQRLAGFAADLPYTVLLEGAPTDGQPEWTPPAGAPARLHVVAPACLCCIGNLTLRVTLARILRLEAPRALVIGIADPAHEGRLRALLAQPPWAGLLVLQD